MKARKVVQVIFLIAVALLLCSCAKIKSNGIPVYKKYWDQTVALLTARAMIDFDCDETPKFLLLSRQGRHPSAVSVEACGRQGIYSRQVVMLAGAGGWQLQRR